MKVRAFPRPSSSGSSTNSIASTARTGSAPAPDWVSLSAAASSRRWGARLMSPIAAIAAARSLASVYRWPRWRWTRSWRRSMAKGATVLVVDDEPPIRRLLRTSLGAQGYDVIEAGNGRDALAIIDRDKPDLVILDLGLPDRAGID